MRKSALVALALLCVLSLSCRRSPVAPPDAGSRIEVFVHWGDEGVPDVPVQIVELGLSKQTDAAGIAVFTLRPGRYIVRAMVNEGGPPRFHDVPVTARAGRNERVEFVDCLPCV